MATSSTCAHWRLRSPIKVTRWKERAKTFGVEHGKQSVTRHGIVTNKYINYNRRDVLATSELAVKAAGGIRQAPTSSCKQQRHIRPLQSAKHICAAMGIQPILQRQPDFPKRTSDTRNQRFSADEPARTSAKCRFPSFTPIFFRCIPR